MVSGQQIKKIVFIIHSTLRDLQIALTKISAGHLSFAAPEMDKHAYKQKNTWSKDADVLSYKGNATGGLTG